MTVTAVPTRDPDYTRGVLLVLLAGVFFSLAGIVLRSMDSATNWQIIFYRSTALAVTMAVVLAVRHRARVVRAFRSAGWSAVIGSLCLASAFINSVTSMLLVTIANSLFLQSSHQFFAAILGWFILKERVRPAAWAAMAVASIGIAIMVGQGFVVGSLLGNLLAVVTAASFAGFAVTVRYGRLVDMTPAVVFAGIFAALVGAAAAHDLAVSTHDLILCVLLGVVQVGFGFIVFTLGSRHVPAAELMLLSLSEVVLGPLLVWLGVGEVPTVLTLIGGAIVLSAIVGLALSGMRQRR